MELDVVLVTNVEDFEYMLKHVYKYKITTHNYITSSIS